MSAASLFGRRVARVHASASELWPAILVAVGYGVGAWIGLQLTPRPQPVSTLWPPNAILMGALFLAPERRWPLLLGASLPVHMAIELSAGVPLLMVASWFVSNAAEAVLGAFLMRRFADRRTLFETFRGLMVFCAAGAILPSFATSFLDAGLVHLNGWGTASYSHVWNERFFSNVLAIVAFVPAIVTWANDGALHWTRAGRARILEAIGIVGGLSLLGAVAFAFASPPSRTAAHLYSPLPLMLWAAARRGTALVSGCVLALTIISVWSAVHGFGPFAGEDVASNVRALQLFLIFTTVPMLALSAVMTERGHAVAGARHNEERLQLALAAARLGTWEWDRQTGRVVVDENWLAVHGLPVAWASIPSRHFNRYVAPADRGSLRTAIRQAVRGAASIDVEFRARLPDGTSRWIASTGAIARDSTGRAICVRGVCADVTDRRKGEAALLASEERFAKAFHAFPDACMIARLSDALVIEVNEAWERTFHCERQAAVGRRIEDLGDFEVSVTYGALMDELKETHRVPGLEVEMRDSLGQSLFLVPVAETVELAGEPCIILMMRDVTARRRAEHEIDAQRRQLAHLGRVALVGELSGALAHELSQPLGAILANTQAGQLLLNRGALSAPEMNVILSDIVSDLRRTGLVIERIRALIRREDPRPEQVSVNEVIAETLGLARSDLLQRNVVVIPVLEPDPPIVWVDRVQLQQVLLNLLVNACDAMAETPPEDRCVTVRTHCEHGVVYMSISDRGLGLPTSAQETLFEPFFSTKKHGMGLGLTICRSIVQANGGRLWATDNPEGGAIFHLALASAEHPRAGLQHILLGSYALHTPMAAAAGPPADRVPIAAESQQLV